MKTLSNLKIEQILEYHHNECKLINGELMVLSKWTVYGKPFEEWINAPTTIQKLRYFLEY